MKERKKGEKKRLFRERPKKSKKNKTKRERREDE